MTLSSEDRAQLIKHYVEKVQNLVEDITFFIDNGKLFTAVNRIYYGIYYMLSALSCQRIILDSHAILFPLLSPITLLDSLLFPNY
ncbi:MAG: hypothetical protein ACMUIP_11040 [bacterium]